MGKYLPEGNRGRIAYDAVRVGVAVGHKKLENNINEEGNLPNYVQDEQFVGEAPEEAEFKGRKEGTVHRPNQYELGP